MREDKTLYEYAGFLYSISFDNQGMLIAKPEKGQHEAAYKLKHRMAAVACYKKDNEC